MENKGQFLDARTLKTAVRVIDPFVPAPLLDGLVSMVCRQPSGREKRRQRFGTRNFEDGMPLTPVFRFGRSKQEANMFKEPNSLVFNFKSPEQLKQAGQPGSRFFAEQSSKQ